MTDQAQKHPRPPREIAEEEVSRNYKAFSQMQFSPEASGHFALLHKGELVETLETHADAIKMGLNLYRRIGYFSVQEINPKPASLGSLNHAVRIVTP